MATERKNEKIKGWIASERPRERLLRHGVTALSDAELLSLFLRSGLPGENVRDLAMRILNGAGGLNKLSKVSSNDLLKVEGLGPAKVASLIAAFDVGRRMLSEQIEERPLLSAFEDLYHLLLHQFLGETNEVFLGILLNAKNRILKTITFSNGDPAQIIISVPQIIRKVLAEGAQAVIFVHNHPSGDPTPSREDRELTQNLYDACRTVDLTMHDHLIFGSKEFYSFSQKGLLPPSPS